MKWDDEVLGSCGHPGLVQWVELRDVDSGDEPGLLDHFFALLSQLGTFVPESLLWQAEWVGSPWCIWNSNAYLSITDLGTFTPLLEKGQPHSLGWDLSVARYQLHLNLTSPPAVPADTSVLFCTLQIWWLQSQKEERLSEGQVYKNIRGKRGEVQNHCKFLPALLCPAVFQKSHFLRLVQTPNKKIKASLLSHILHHTITKHGYHLYTLIKIITELLLYLKLCFLQCCHL